MNTRIRIFSRNRMKTKVLPIHSFRRPMGGVPDWLASARMLTSHHPITGQLITDTELNNKILKGNQSAIERHDNPPRDQEEVDAEIQDELIQLFNIKQMSNLKE